MTFENKIQRSTELVKGNVVLPFIQAAIHISPVPVKIVQELFKNTSFEIGEYFAQLGIIVPSQDLITSLG